MFIDMKRRFLPIAKWWKAHASVRDDKETRPPLAWGCKGRPDLLTTVVRRSLQTDGVEVVELEILDRERAGLSDELNGSLTL